MCSVINLCGFVEMWHWKVMMSTVITFLVTWLNQIVIPEYYLTLNESHTFHFDLKLKLNLLEKSMGLIQQPGESWFQ